MNPAIMHYTANADYEEHNSEALHLAPGDRVKAGAEDRAWPGWVWVVGESGRCGYVPKEILSQPDVGEAIALEAFDPSVLAIRRGDRITSLRQIHGWHWCRNEKGGEGWVAGYLLRPALETGFS